MDKRFMGILVGLVVIFVAVFALTKNSSNNGSSGSSSNQSQTTNHIEGQGQKGVTLVEYGDYECPICGVYYQPLKQVAAQFDKEIYFQFRNLPLTSIHANAFAAARAAEAAAQQNKFWEMHDALYDTQTDWSSSQSPQTIFESYAQQLGLNVTQFKQDYSSSKVNDAINADLAAFNKTGQAMATPTFFLDGHYIPNTQFSDPQTGAPSVTKLAAVINAEIAKKAAAKK
jgi:protein-disulfide isomerase